MIRRRILFAGFALALLGAACGGATQAPTESSVPATRTAQASATSGRQSATATLLPSDTPATSPTPQPATPTLAPFPVSGDSSASLQRFVSQRGPANFQVPLARGPNDHFYFARPFGAGDFDRPWPATRYAEVRLPETGIGHTGIDYGMAPGVPILAAGDGTVVWVGYGLLKNFSDPKDPYGIAVAIRHDISYEGQTLYTVYAHLSEAFVEDGQEVKLGEEIGIVGSTGQSTGTHLHFEVRLGKNNILLTRNPALWIAPPENSGVLVGQLFDTNGVELKNKLVQVTSLTTGKHIVLYSYAADTNFNKDDYFQENFVLNDLPAGRYEIAIPYITIWIRVEVEIKPGAITFFTFHGYDRYHFLLPEVQPPPNVPRVGIEQ